ncbi:histidinol dehydrogenase [Alicyclobacillus contaminans]|uniref:histidinol dehydrogenase n=1 Tax=Alicyclobacillus contaminans TaxID=392016 RepID=UPI00042408E1|nr:histidinol dehydrogenase [Alicyclobacillus contaminans]GMA49664.1 histidinol dehydrogenase [Alicyclobacillus contaminans]
MRLKRVPASEWQWQRTQGADTTRQDAVRAVIQAVRVEGDAAVRRFTAKYDGVAGATNPDFSLRVSPDAMAAAYAALAPAIREALERAADRIRNFHALQKRSDITRTGTDGERLGLVWRPLQRVGVYAPGGRAAYPSTVLMNVIPAQVAGVPEIVLVSPPQSDTGLPHPLVLAAAHLLGVDEVYRMGGAQAVAALAYGTESIRKVDKIVGPGNAYVAHAKRWVSGDVGIDNIAGPSEVFIVADETANPAYVAADMLAQAEHDPDAGAVCVTTHEPLADALDKALAQQLAALPRRDVAAASLEAWGAVVVAKSMDEALAVVNRAAPEHVELLVAQPDRWLARVHTAGAVFLGSHTPEPVGDYYAGTNHVLPTFGTARFASGLGVDDFVRRMSWVEYTPAALRAHAADIRALAEAEGLQAHAAAVAIREQEEEGP